MPDKIPAVGSRAMVMHGNALHTSGGLKKEELKYNSSGSIVSKRKSEQGKVSFKRNGLKPATKSELARIRR
jgi:hypothetical protein